ncbi:MAG: GerMN domain-containing protein [Treponema sp.]|jgi:hypothetical protein|nr:GerMN domain-containing protein [Treponema sp.]
MKAEIKDMAQSLAALCKSPAIRYAVCLLILGILALGEFFNAGLVRRTFVFYSLRDGETVVEDRMLKASTGREEDLRRYLEEALLGPVSPDSAPLFPRETRLRSLLFRDGTVYVDLSESAVLPYPDGGNAWRDFFTLYGGIKRNFPYVRDVRLFVGGRAAFYDEFRQIQAESHERGVDKT